MGTTSQYQLGSYACGLYRQLTISVAAEMNTSRLIITTLVVGIAILVAFAVQVILAR